MEELSLFETEGISNKELTITYNPNSSVSKYTYVILKNGNSNGEYNISSNKPSDINLFETGNYEIIITTYDKYNRKTVINSGKYQLDMEAPIILAQNSITVERLKDDTYTLEDLGISATDTHDGNLDVKCNFDKVDFNSLGMQNLTCTVADEAGNVTTKEININVVSGNTGYLLLFQISILTLLVILMIIIFKFTKSLKYEKLITKYSLSPLHDHKKSLEDKLFEKYKKINYAFASKLYKSKFLTNYSKRYKKYLVLYNKTYENEMQFVAAKMLLGIVLILIAMFSKMTRYQILNIYELCVPLVFGFFLPDIIYFYKYLLYRNKLENDLLQGIIIMNNAFKSGRSITQAVELVAKELDGPMSLEFSKMSMELNFGLAVDVVFNRLSERINLEEISYLTASLSVLNKTGGNIIKVFTSIEKNLFNKKRLKLELKSLTGSSKIIVYILYVVPILFVLFISLISPTYFEPFYTTKLGIIMIIFMIIIYVIYIWCVQKIMKVRM